MKSVLASFLAAIVSLPLVLTACDGANSGSLGHGGAGGQGTGGKDPGTPQDLVNACHSLCAAFGDANCPKWVTQDQCDAQCAALPASVDADCLSETAEYYSCAGSVDYKCMDGYPTPETQLDAIECLEEQAKANLCLQGKTCRDYCKAAAAEGCGGESFSACTQACEDARATAVYCYSEYELLRQCEAMNMACQGGKPAPTGCSTQKSDLITCLQQESSGDPCDAYCWIAQDEGCDTGTLEECQAKCAAALTPEVQDAYGCSFEMDDLRACEGAGLTCQSGDPVVTASCGAEELAFAQCYDTYNACGASCWLKAAQGCANGGFDVCLTDCEATLTAASYCDYEYEQLLECQIDNDIACTPASTACQSQKDSYDSCIANL